MKWLKPMELCPVQCTSPRIGLQTFPQQDRIVVRQHVASAQFHQMDPATRPARARIFPHLSLNLLLKPSTPMASSYRSLHCQRPWLGWSMWQQKECTYAVKCSLGTDKGKGLMSSYHGIVTSTCLSVRSFWISSGFATGSFIEFIQGWQQWLVKRAKNLVIHTSSSNVQREVDEDICQQQSGGTPSPQSVLPTSTSTYKYQLYKIYWNIEIFRGADFTVWLVRHLHMFKSRVSNVITDGPKTSLPPWVRWRHTSGANSNQVSGQARVAFFARSH